MIAIQIELSVKKGTFIKRSVRERNSATTKQRKIKLQKQISTEKKTTKKNKATNQRHSILTLTKENRDFAHLKCECIEKEINTEQRENQVDQITVFIANNNHK